MVRPRLTHLWDRASRIFTPSSPQPIALESNELVATVPNHRAYLFLNSVAPPTTFPSRFATPLQRALQLKFVNKGGLVNLSWDGSAISDDKTRLTVFSAKGRLEIPDLSLHAIEDHEDNLLRHFELPGLNYSRVEDEFTDLYVCTHGARDCRCADRGGPLAEALRQETSTDPSIRIHEVAHVGKHNLAANVLVYPLGEWLGLLTAEDAPRLIEALRRVKCRPFTGADPPLM